MGSKQDLLLTIMRDAMHEMIGGAREALSEADGTPNELAGLARAHVMYNGENLLDAYVGDAEIRSLDPAESCAHRQAPRQLRGALEGRN